MKQSDYNKRNKRIPTNVIDGWLIVHYSRFVMRVKIDLPNGEYLMVQGKLIRIKDAVETSDPFHFNSIPQFIGIIPKSDIIALKDMHRFAEDEIRLRPHFSMIQFDNSEMWATNASVISYRPSSFNKNIAIPYSPVLPKEECGIYKTNKGFFVSWGDVEIIYNYDHDRKTPGITYLKQKRNKHAFILEKEMIFEAMKVCRYINQNAVAIKKSVIYPLDRNGYDYSLELEKEVPSETADGAIMNIMNEKYYSFDINLLYSLFGNHKRILLNLGEIYEYATFKYLD